MLIGLIIIILIVAFDQGSKYLAQYLLSGSADGTTVIKGVLSFQYVENTGAAWGIFAGKSIFLFVITIIALIGFGYLFTKSNFKRKKVFSISIALLIAGTFGNALDRLILSYVIDFIHIPFLTPVLGVVGLSNFWFNIADLALTVGIVLLAIDLIFIEPKRAKERDAGSIYERMESQEPSSPTKD